MERNTQKIREEIIRISGVNPNKCMQCGKCSGTCPAYEEMEPCPWHFVVCSHYRGGCGASGGWELTEEKAIESWNRRA